MTILVLQSIFETWVVGFFLYFLFVPLNYQYISLGRQYFEGDTLVWRITGGFRSVWHGAVLVANRAADLKIRPLKGEMHIS